MPDGRTLRFCHPEQVDSGLDRLSEIHEPHLTVKGPPDIEAAWLHHRFIQIHPFRDGNGRVAGALVALVYIKAVFFPPIVAVVGKSEHIGTLNLATKADLGPSVRFLSDLVNNDHTATRHRFGRHSKILCVPPSLT
jgi:hypothetical protein